RPQSYMVSRVPKLYGLLLSAIFVACTSPALGQRAPGSPGHPWHAPEEMDIQADAKKFSDVRFNVDPEKTYSLADLIDLAETHNPDTRAAWQRALSQAAALGVVRSELYPTLTAAALSQVIRSEVYRGNQFFRQTIGDFQVALDLSYLIFD